MRKSSGSVTGAISPIIKTHCVCTGLPYQEYYTLDHIEQWYFIPKSVTKIILHVHCLHISGLCVRLRSYVHVCDDNTTG